MPVDRRDFVKVAAGAGSIALAGCTGDGDGDGTTSPGGTPTSAEPTMDPNREYEEVGSVDYLTLARGANPTYYQEAQQAQTMLEKLGFTFNEKVQEAGQWVSTLFAKDYDMANIGWSNTPERLFPYYNLYFSFHSTYTGEGGGNFSEWGTDEYDQAVENFTEAMQLEPRQEYANKCQTLLAKNVPVAYMTNPTAFVAHNTNNYTGWQRMIGAYAYFNPISLMTAEPQGDTNSMVLATVSPPENFPNFMAHTGPSAVFLHKMNYDPLVQLDVDGNPVTKGAAESWEVVDDTTIDVTIREGMTFHDGEAVTVDDVMFTWDYAKEWGITYLASDIAPYESSEAMGDRTVRFHLNQPFAGFVPVSLYRLPILPKHVWDGVTEREGIEQPSQWQDPTMTGSGPFKMVNYDSGNQIRFEKFQDHYHADEYDFDVLIYNMYGTNAAAVGALTSGTADIAQGLGYSDWQRAKDSPNTAAKNNRSIRVNGVFINTQHEPFNDVLVRQAVAFAINRSQIINTVHQGYGNPAKSTIAQTNQRYHNENVKPYEFSLAKAKEKLFESGFRYDGDTLVKPTDWSPKVEFVSAED